MTYPIQSPERSALIPVIATLLQFNTEELKEIRNNSNIWSAPRLAKTVTRMI